ncbi:NAD(P)-binding protein [Glonium stellatum]|uniref:Peroxisomal trans-2-enoyl-CoA reductase n=1 Tax=Glonium stellatum TaxID=574774 RepID=A0A8E2ETI3_9PEZI|nr:NAD(P)-binding protein [Glonium stellatum]
MASRIHPVISDVAKEQAVLEGMKKTVAIGKPHILVNNAGPVAIGAKAGFIDMVEATFSMIHFVTTALRQNQRRVQALLISLRLLDRYLKEAATVELKGDIRVNAVAPGGPIRTPRNATFIDEGVFSKTIDRNPSGRPGKPEELANGIMFLLSLAAGYINGHMLCIDGGLSVAE